MRDHPRSEVRQVNADRSELEWVVGGRAFIRQSGENPRKESSMTSRAVKLNFASVPKDCSFWLEDDGWNAVCDELSLTVRGSSLRTLKPKWKLRYRHTRKCPAKALWKEGCLTTTPRGGHPQHRSLTGPGTARVGIFTETTLRALIPHEFRLRWAVFSWLAHGLCHPSL